MYSGVRVCDGWVNMSDHTVPTLAHWPRTWINSMVTRHPLSDVDARQSDPHGCPGARELTLVWGCKGGGVPWANTQPGGRSSFSCGVWVLRSRAPPLAGHRGGAPMVQGGLHRGLAVCMGLPSLHVAQPAPGLYALISPPCSCFGPLHVHLGRGILVGFKEVLTASSADMGA